MDKRFAARGLAVLMVAATAVSLIACGSDEDSGPPPFTAAVLNSNLGVGPNRIVVGLIDRESGALITDATVEAHLYGPGSDPYADPPFEGDSVAVALPARTLDVNEEHLDGATANLEGVGEQRPIANVQPRIDTSRLPAHEGNLTTVYAALVEFDRVGTWGIAIDVTIGDKTYRDVELTATVSEHTSEPAVGDPAPRSDQLTLADVDDIADVSTSTQPIPEMLDKTIAEALDSGQPVVIAFATPAFCQTQFCGPVLETVVVPLYEEFKSLVQFVHVEPYDLPKVRTGTFQPVPAAAEWKLLSEPFVFIVGRDGNIAAKFEGVMDQDELRGAIEATLD